ncbi:MAG: aromatic ring-hydroxylating dioxygenase subunit alpha [Alphaproteobacteria bacterium]|nr:aromatic ring-hydroxylating dioxygenase subunit alpha [Alphaproteobacteria bacterium]
MAQFVRNQWYPAAWEQEVGRDLLARTLLGEKVVLYRTEAGAPVALEDRCCHKFLPLSMGALKGDALQCGYHGMTYDPSGACIRIPGQASIPPMARVRSYPARRHLGMVWLWMGDPALADEAKLFQLPQYDDPDWTLSCGPYTYVKACYQHITDNLLDPAHVSFVHESTLGSPASEDVPVETRQDGNSVIVSRWTYDAKPIPLLEKFADFRGNVDRWQYYYFHAPSIAIVDFGSGDAGMGDSDEDRDRAVRIYSCHFIAPETEQTSHYFWFQLRNFAPGDDAVSKAMTEQFILAFDEDKAILEAVQAAEREASERPPVKLAIDNGPTRARRLVERMIRAEEQATIDAD